MSTRGAERLDQTLQQKPVRVSSRENMLKRKICFWDKMIGQSIKCASEKVSQPAENTEFWFHQKLKAQNSPHSTNQRSPYPNPTEKDCMWSSVTDQSHSLWAETPPTVNHHFITETEETERETEERARERERTSERARESEWGSESERVREREQKTGRAEREWGKGESRETICRLFDNIKLILLWNTKILT